MSSSIRVRRRLDGHLIAGTVNFAAPLGLLVNYDPTDITKLTKATGTKAFSLLRKTVPLADLQSQLVEDQVFMAGLPVQNPAVIGDTVSASRIAEAELEGPDYLLTSGTGVINASTAIGTELSTHAGVLSAKQNGEEVVGHLRAKLPVLDSDNLIRALVEFVV